MCSKGHDIVKVNQDQALETIGELQTAKNTPSVAMWCYICEQHMHGKPFFKCKGQGRDGQICGRDSRKGDCIWLPQVVPCPPGQKCAVYLDEVEDKFVFRFDNCG